MDLSLSQIETDIENNMRFALDFSNNVDESMKKNTVMAFARYCKKPNFSEMTFENIAAECSSYNCKQKMSTINSKGKETKMNSAVRRQVATQQLLYDLNNGILVVDLNDFYGFYIHVDFMLQKFVEADLDSSMKNKLFCIYKRHYHFGKNHSDVGISQLRETASHKFDVEYKKIADTVSLPMQESLFLKGSDKLFSLGSDLSGLWLEVHPATETKVHPREPALFCCKNHCFECQQCGTTCHYS